MSGHTKGPWFIDHETRPAEVCTIHHTSHPNGYVYVRGEIGYWDADGDENMANARLIAAAPDLLEALIDLVYQVDQPNQPSWLSLDQARAAIAKATGETT